MTFVKFLFVLALTVPIAVFMFYYLMRLQKEFVKNMKKEDEQKDRAAADRYDSAYRNDRYDNSRYSGGYDQGTARSRFDHSDMKMRYERSLRRENMDVHDPAERRPKRRKKRKKRSER